MSTAYAFDTIPAYPLGIPHDGRPRYGMTPEQAIVYRWLVKYRPHNGAFRVNFRELAKLTISSHNMTHERVQALVERGWLKPERALGHYSFVHPVREFREVRA